MRPAGYAQTGGAGSVLPVGWSGSHLQDDVVEADEVLRLGAPLALVGVGLLQLGVQRVSHALVPLHQRAQLDVAQVTAGQPGADVTASPCSILQYHYWL